MFNIYGYWAWRWSNGLELGKCEIKLVYVVVIFGIKYEYMMLDDYFKSIWDDLDAHLRWVWAKLSLLCMNRVDFELNVCIWIKLHGIWRLIMLLAWKWMFCEVCPN